MIILTLTCWMLLSCATKSKSNTSADTSRENILYMQIDGVEWSADSDIFGSYHFSEELGPKIINIAGTKGVGGTQQAFNINLFNTDKEGIYTVNIPDNSTATSYQNVAQMGNYTPANYLCGGTMQGSQLTVNVTKVSKNPQIIEATFSGKMQCVQGSVLQITDGKFYYHE